MAFFSTNSSDYAAAINKLKKPTYESQYGSTISDLMDKIANREKFSYDFNADPLYQNYKDAYTKAGNEAAMNAAAAVSANTGGYGNSYAGTAAAQANQQYLTQMNNMIPQLADAALRKYQMETEDLYNKFGMYQSEENRLYGQHRDSVADYYSDWGNLQNGYGTALSKEQWEAQMQYQMGRDQVADSQWQKQFDNENYWKQLAYEQSKSKGTKSAGGTKDNGGDVKINTSESRSIDYQNATRTQNILNAARALSSDDEKMKLLEKIAASDSKFTKGDLDWFMKQLNLK